MVAGIGGYGNCIGVPTVGGELYFDESYRDNCLVNAMCVGIIEQSKLTRAAATGAGNLVLLVGADTGRDGIHGATFASVELDEAVQRAAPRRPGRQPLSREVPDGGLPRRSPATRESSRCRTWVLPGSRSSSAELAHRGGCGIEIDVARVSRRETRDDAV